MKPFASRSNRSAAASLVDGPLVPDQLLTTTRCVRRRLDLGRPVERSVVEDCLRLAFQAPSGGNSQGWSWVLVDDADTKKRMGEIYRAGLTEHHGRTPGPSEVADPFPPIVNDALRASVRHLTANIESAPVLLVPTIYSRFGRETTFQQAYTWASILPAVWNFMLALRAHGMGSAWAAVHLYREREMAELLGIPYPTHTQAGLFPLGYTIGTSFSPGDRTASEKRVFWNRWNET
jgi:nitroreductase